MQRSQIILMISNWKTIIIWNDCMFLFHGQIRNYHYYHSSSYLISNYFNCMGSERNIWHRSIQFHFWDDTSDQLELLLLSNRKVHFCIYIQDFWQVSLFQFVCSVLNAIAPSPMKYISTNSTVETRLATARASYPLSIHPSPYYSILFHTIPFHSPLSVFLRAERFQTHNLLPSMSIFYDRSKHIQIIPYI